MGKPRPSLGKPRTSLGKPRTSLGKPRPSLGGPRSRLGGLRQRFEGPRPLVQDSRVQDQDTSVQGQDLRAQSPDSRARIGGFGARRYLTWLSGCVLRPTIGPSPLFAPSICPFVGLSIYPLVPHATNVKLAITGTRQVLCRKWIWKAFFPLF